MNRSPAHKIAHTRPAFSFALVLALAALELSCGSHSTPQTPTPTPVPTVQLTFSHVFLVVEENHSYSEVIGNPAMPYLNSLVVQNGLATQYYADAHPSIGNYFMLTTGQLETLDDSFSGIVSDDNIL